jgi:branched-chain amino acid transport system ATP-binding protein
MEAVLSAENIIAGYQNRRVLHGVTLHIDQSEKVLLIGPNGSGKSTLLKVLAGVLLPEEGRVVLKRQDISHTFGYQRMRLGLGYLMQRKNVFPSLTIKENLHLSFWRNDGSYVKRLSQILEIFPMLKKYLNHRAGFLSGGERQALAIGMVLMRPVDILLLDEPTAGLSPEAASSILEALQEAQITAKFSAIIVEHNLRLVHQLASRVIVMNQGSIIAEEQDPNALLNPEKLQGYYFR